MSRSDDFWVAVQAYYDEGHSVVECQARFNFSNGAWDRARLRGQVRSRSRGGWNRGRDTRAAVENLLNQGLRNGEVAVRLGISTATVSYHARKLGVPPDTRFSRRVDWKAVQVAHDEGLSVRDCARKFGFHRGSWNQAVQRGAIKPRSHLIPLNLLLVAGRKSNRTHLKARIMAAGLKENRCERCGINEWNGSPLGVQLHHKNGVGDDNRVENLEFLCPNCHSQTENWGGRNKLRRPPLKLVEPLPNDDSGVETG